jgi:transcriptional regulator with XRE-family HTH domain
MFRFKGICCINFVIAKHFGFAGFSLYGKNTTKFLYSESCHMDPRTLIASQVSDTRRRRGLRLRDLAKRTGKNPARISELENGKSNSTIDFLDEIGKALGLTLMFVPDEKVMDVQAMTAEHGHEVAPTYDVPTVFEEVFIDDTEEGGDHGFDHR